MGPEQQYYLGDESSGDGKYLSKFQLLASVPRDISSRIDKFNVIPERVTHIRKSKEIYAVALRDVVSGIDGNHTSFSAHITTDEYQNLKHFANLEDGAKQDSTKLH